MIRKVTLTRFKRFEAQAFTLEPTGVTFLAGGNNSGKSSLLQALAVWEFARTVLEMERGSKSLLADYAGQGLGMADDEFSPMALPSLKHLWTNLKSQGGVDQNGYSLKILCEWDDAASAPKSLGISLALANDRLFIKASDSNLAIGDKVPRVAYLPSFAGITSREQFMSPADRRAMVGRGMAGGVIRNLLLDMARGNERARKAYKGERTKIRNSDLARLRREDAWERLQATLVDVFQTELSVAPFNDVYHSYIRVSAVKGGTKSGKFVKHPNFNARDMMAEGSGFLQWLSVYSLALDPTVDVLLLDEPDAHLHPSLQAQLVERLQQLVSADGKQVLLATHSTEILRWADHSRILAFAKGKASYLKSDGAKIPLFLGLGSDYAPKLDPLRRHKRMIIVENLGDFRRLKIFAERLGTPLPENVVAWPWVGGPKERKQLYLQLSAEIPDLEVISLRDRDDGALDQVERETLRDKSIDNNNAKLRFRTWRRRHIENYMLWPPAIARAAGVAPEEVVGHFGEKFALVVPADFGSRDVAHAMIDARGKELTTEGPDSIKARFGVTPDDIANAMTPDEVAEDIKTLVSEIIGICQVPEA